MGNGAKQLFHDGVKIFPANKEFSFSDVNELDLEFMFIIEYSNEIIIKELILTI